MRTPRKILFATITLAIPAVVFLLLECSLRIGQYGPNLSLFVIEELCGIPHYIMNPEVKARYFRNVAFSPTSSIDYFPVSKDSGAFRIFCLGGSTTVGYPYFYNAAFSTFLRDRLGRTFPGRNIEVINLGMTATNSFTVVDIASELMEYQPDLLIVYDGHNEFYGALGLASNESLGQFPTLTRMYLKLIRSRSFILFRDFYSWCRTLFDRETVPSEAPSTMMERLAKGQYVQSGSSLYRRTLETFRENLIALGSIARDANVPVILGSQVSNLHDLPPFISRNSDRLSSTALSDFNREYESAKRNFPDNPDSSLASFSRAITIDSTFAEAHYRYARCLEQVGRLPEARVEYRRARDHDQLRFRAATDFNNAIQNVASDERMYFCDVEEAFEQAAPDSFIGGLLLTEHLHPNTRGYFIMARAYATTMKVHGLLASSHDWEAADTTNEDALWEKRPVSQLDERIADRRTSVLLSGWPFTNHGPIVNAVSPSDTIGVMAEHVVRARWSWLQAHESLATYLLARGRLHEAAEEYRIIINQLPRLNVHYYLRRAKILLDLGKTQELEGTLLASLRVEPTILAFRALADIALNSNRPTEAARLYKETFAFSQTPQEQLQNGYLLGLAYAKAGQGAQAKSELLKVLKISPDFQPAIKLLQQLSLTR